MPNTKSVAKETKETKSKDTKESIKKVNVHYYYAVGRRREAVARVRLYVSATDEKITVGDTSYEKGAIVINKRPVESYFPGEISKKRYLEPFRTTNNLTRFVTTIKIVGGGLSGQLDAVIHGISRALEKIDREKYRPILKKRGFLTRDSRIKQRRKAGFAGKSRKMKQSPKR